MIVQKRPRLEPTSLYIEATTSRLRLDHVSTWASKKSVPQEAENPQDAEDYEKDDSEWKTVSRVSGALPRPVVFILSDLVT